VIETIDNPLITSLEDDLLGAFGNFPDSLLLIALGNGKYAANQADTPDGQKINGLACFPNVEEAISYTNDLKGLNGEFERKSFAEAREIAQSKPILHAMFLFVEQKIVEIHFVR
jgi:hypothetical protein